MIFWLITIALLVIALAILVLPMMRAARVPVDDARREQNIAIAREQKHQLDAQLEAGEIDAAAHAAARADLETALALELEAGERGGEAARGRWMAAVLVVALPLASVLLYLGYGELRVIENPALAAARAPAAPAAPQMTLDEMQTAIRARLQQNPEDAEGWFMLGRVLMAKQEYANAVTAYQRTYDLVGDEPGVMFALADALAMKNNGNLLGEPEELVKRGLELAPRFPNGLWLAGMAAEQRGDEAAAHRYWTQLLPLIQDNPDSVREIRALLAMLEERDPALAQAAPTTAAAGATLNLSVDIAADLKAKAAAGDAVFVYAKAMQGPPMPLAVRRLRVADLPVTVTLSDDDAMMPALKLSLFEQVVVGARVSPSGNPVAQAGDFYTERDGISSADPPAEITLVIDRVK